MTLNILDTNSKRVKILSHIKEDQNYSVDLIKEPMAYSSLDIIKRKSSSKNLYRLSYFDDFSTHNTTGIRLESVLPNWDNWIGNKFRYGKDIIDLNGKALILGQCFNNNYGHVLHDHIQYIFKLLESDFDFIFIPHSKVLFDILSTFKIELNKKFMVINPKEDMHITVDELHIENRSTMPFKEKKFIKKFKKHLDKFLLGESDSEKTIIYYKRKSSDVHNARVMNIKNEEAILNLIRDSIKKHNRKEKFVIYDGLSRGERMSYIDQAKLFYSAKFVIGAHGSGLANTIFINPKNKSSVCEFTSGTSKLVWGNKPFLKNYNTAYCDYLDKFTNYNLIPFTKESSTSETLINLQDMQNFLDLYFPYDKS